MGLEELRISKNGGVYFEGTRVDPTKDPVLFVGLGGTGVDALLRIKNEVQCRMHLPKGEGGKVIATSPENIAFVAMDTDREVLKKRHGIASFSKTGNEFISLSVDGLPLVMNAVREKHMQDEEWKWFDPDINGGGGLQGANGIRQVGRFMLFQNINSVTNALKEALIKVRKASEKIGGKSPMVFVLTGIGGGTGSGTFLDVAYILRQIAYENAITNLQIHGYIFTPDLNATLGANMDALYRNGFASLKELDYWMSTAEHHDQFVQKYSPQFKVNSKERPFNFCHIITGRKSNGGHISYKEAMDIVGYNLFSYIVSEETESDGNSSFKQMYDNIDNYIVTAAKPVPANYNYLSVGSDRYEIPYTEITTLVAARVFEKLKPFFDNEPDQASFDFDLAMMGMRSTDFWNYINANIPVHPLQLKKYEYKDIWPENIPYQVTHHWINGADQAEQMIRKNRANLQSVYEGKFVEYAERIMKGRDKDAGRGPCYAARMLQSNSTYCLINTLEGLKNDCKERIAGGQSQLPQLENAMKQAYISGQSAGLFGRGAATKEYLTALENWSRATVTLWAYIDLADGLNDLIERLKRYYSLIFGKLLETLHQMPGIFEENEKFIREAEIDARKNPDTAPKYLLTATEFERKFAEQLQKRTDVAAQTFAESLVSNLKKWVGVENIRDINSGVFESPDIAGAIAAFVDSHFGETIKMNMETLLIDKVTPGTNTEEYLFEKLKQLQASSLTLFQMDVQALGIRPEQFSMISVPEDCPTLFNVAKDNFGRMETPKKSSELSKLQWAKVAAGMPLFAFPEVTMMEKAYENAMSGGRQQRIGVHLNYQWREELPSPLPESSWTDAVSIEPQKEYTKKYNAEIRKAFDICAANGIIRLTPTGDKAKLYLASNADFSNVEIRSTQDGRNEQIRNLKNQIWGDESTAISLDPCGTPNGSDDTMKRIRENALRFYVICNHIKEQAAIVEKLNAKFQRFELIGEYVDAYLTNMIFEQGIYYKLRRSEFDEFPMKLLSKLEIGETPDYSLYGTFCSLVTEDVQKDLRKAFDGQIATIENGITDSFRERIDALRQLSERLNADKSALEVRMMRSDSAQAETLKEVYAFYADALKQAEARLKMFG